MYSIQSKWEMPASRETISKTYLYISKITIVTMRMRAHTHKGKLRICPQFTPEGQHGRDRCTILQVLIFKQCMEKWLYMVPSSITSTYLAAHSCWHLKPQGLSCSLPASLGTACMWCTDTDEGRIPNITTTTANNNNHRNTAISTETQTKALTNISDIVKSDSIEQHLNILKFYYSCLDIYTSIYVTADRLAVPLRQERTGHKNII